MFGWKSYPHKLLLSFTVFSAVCNLDLATLEVIDLIVHRVKTVPLVP